MKKLEAMIRFTEREAMHALNEDSYMEHQRRKVMDKLADDILKHADTNTIKEVHPIFGSEFIIKTETWIMNGDEAKKVEYVLKMIEEGAVSVQTVKYPDGTEVTNVKREAY